jgi:hypothetical protein
LSSRLLSKNGKIKIPKAIILPLVLYGCENWSLTLREEQRLRLFENSMLRKIFPPKRDEVIQEDKMGGACSSHGEDDKYVQDFSWKA